MTGKLAGTAAVITSGSTGMALATAECFGDEGMNHKFVTDRRRDALDAAIAGIAAGVTAVQRNMAKLMAKTVSFLAPDEARYVSGFGGAAQIRSRE